MSGTIERIIESAGGSGTAIYRQAMANSFLVSSDVIHAVNPNFLGVYLENHSPRLNVGVAVSADPNGHMTTDSVSTAFLQRVAEKSGSKLQVFQIRNDSRSGGTIGPMTSSRLGCRAIDCGIPQLSMHSIRATTGSLDPGLGVKLYKGFFTHYEEVDKEFADGEKS
jgi:aminopeptidase I